MSRCKTLEDANAKEINENKRKVDELMDAKTTLEFKIDHLSNKLSMAEEDVRKVTLQFSNEQKLVKQLKEKFEWVESQKVFDSDTFNDRIHDLEGLLSTSRDLVKELKQQLNVSTSVIVKISVVFNTSDYSGL